MRAHLRRLVLDWRLVTMTLAALALAVALAKPQVYTLSALAELDPELLWTYQARLGVDSLSIGDFARWYAREVLLPHILGGSATAILVAAVVGAGLVGDCLSGPVKVAVSMGRSRTRIILDLWAAVMAVGAVTSLLLSGLILLVYGRDCLNLLGYEAWPLVLRAVLWRLGYDLAAFCPAMLFACLTLEANISLLGGALLAVLMSFLGLLKEQLWWFPSYAVQTVILQPDALRPKHLFPSILLLVAAPLAGILRLRYKELR